MTSKEYNYLRSRQFIIDFLETIEQPLSEKEVQNILEGSKYLDELLRTQKEAIDAFLNETF
jgi:arsenate reductase-like glutaredoxin family protein